MLKFVEGTTLLYIHIYKATQMKLHKYNLHET